MRTNLFWLDDEQWTKIKPLIPINRPGQKPRNNRRILISIIRVPIAVTRIGVRETPSRAEYGVAAP
jgi:transposase